MKAEAFNDDEMTFRNDQHKREVKRQIKKRGGKARRQALKRSLEDDPDEAGPEDYKFKKGKRSKDLNDSPYDW